MKFDLFESGLQNMRQIAKDYNEAIIYGHIDLDGIASSLAAKAYLEKYGKFNVSQFSMVQESLLFQNQKIKVY